MGSLIRMGPGYFLLMLGILLTAIAVLILFSPEALTDDGDTDDGVVLTMREQVTTWALVVGSVILFIIIGKYGGLIPATLVMCSLAALGDKRSEEHTSELQSRGHLVCRLLLEKKKENKPHHVIA